MQTIQIKGNTHLRKVVSDTRLLAVLARVASLSCEELCVESLCVKTVF